MAKFQSRVPLPPPFQTEAETACSLQFLVHLPARFYRNVSILALVFLFLLAFPVRWLIGYWSAAEGFWPTALCVFGFTACGLSVVFMLFFWYAARAFHLKYPEVIGVHDIPYVQEPGQGNGAPLIKPKYDQRFGNKLFQYTFSRLFAQVHGYDFRADPLPSPLEAVETSVDADPSLVDEENAKRIVAIPSTRWACNVDYFKGEENRIREWFHQAVDQALEKYQDELPTREQREQEVVIHLREGDTQYGMYSMMAPLPLDFYLQYLPWFSKKCGEEEAMPEYIRLVTEDANSNMVKAIQQGLLQAGAKVVLVQAKSLEVDFLTMVAAKRLVLSVSTFSWWAALLSEGEVLYPEWGLFRPEYVDCVIGPGPKQYYNNLRLDELRAGVHVVPLPNLGPYPGKFRWKDNITGRRGGNVDSEPDVSAYRVPWSYRTCWWHVGQVVGILVFALLGKL